MTFPGNATGYPERDTGTFIFLLKVISENLPILSAIMGRITVNGQAAQFSCKQTVALSLWDAKANRAKGKGPEAQKINHALVKIKAKVLNYNYD